MRAAPADLATRVTIINTQRKYGRASAYSAGPAGVLGDGAGGTMQLTYTPPVPAWWAISGGVGILQKTDAAYNYIYTYLNLNPADQDGVAGGQLIGTQYNGVQTYESHSIRRIYRLAAGRTYSCQLCVGSGSGGTWQYNTDPSLLWIEGQAWLQ